MTAEELKEAVRRYADEHHPDWRVAAVSIRIGALVEYPDELLVIKPADPRTVPGTLARRGG